MKYRIFTSDGSETIPTAAVEWPGRKRFKTPEEYIEYRKEISRREELREQLKQIKQRPEPAAREELQILIHCDLR